jgi:hypothetical protein
MMVAPRPSWCVVISGVTKEAGATARIRLLHGVVPQPLCDVEVKVFPQIRRQDPASMQDLFMALPTDTRHRDPTRIQQPDAGEVNVVHLDRHVIAVEGLGVVVVHDGPLSLL